ncbi:MAG: MFS transporter [Spirochaetales bacterium]|nr:MFS transporter [Spirochaetales bacterium]
MYRKFCAYGFLKNLQFFDPFLVLFFRERGISFFEIGVLYSVREIMTNVTEIPTGVIADTIGRRTAMVLAFISYIISFALFYLFPTFPVFIAAMVFFAFGESFRSGTHKAMILEYLKLNNLMNHKVAYYGHTRSWSQIGSAVMALTAGLMVFFTGDYRSVFLYSIAPYLLGMVLIMTYPRELDFSPEEGESAAKDEKRRIGDTVKDFLRLFTDRQVRRALINSSLFDGFFKAVKDYVQPILKGLALTLPLMIGYEDHQRVAVVSGGLYFLLYLGTSQAARHSSRLNDLIPGIARGLNITFLAQFLIIGGIALSLILGSPLAAVILFVILYLLENVRRPYMLGYLSGKIKGSVMATGLSGESQLKTLLVAVLAPVLGKVVDGFGLGYGLLILAGISLVALIAVPIRDKE